MGYDTAVIGGTMALDSFRRDFGLDVISQGARDTIQGNIVSTFQGGCFFGVLMCYPILERLGHRLTLMLCGAVFNLGAILQIVQVGDLGFIYGGRVLTGKWMRKACSQSHTQTD